MFYKFIYSKIRISSLKIRLVINKIRYYSISNILLYLNFFFNKSCKILKKIFLSSLNSLKNNFNINSSNIVLKNISAESDGIIKRIFYRSRGRYDILRKPYTNIILKFYHGTKG